MQQSLIIIITITLRDGLGVTRNSLNSSWMEKVKLKKKINRLLTFSFQFSVLFGNYWLYIENIWALKDQANVKIVHFEEMKADLKGAIKELAGFFEKKLTEEQMDNLCRHLDFKNMKNNPLLNRDDLVEYRKKQWGIEDSQFKFLRKGQVGSHKEEMPEEFVERFDEKTEEEFKRLGICYVDPI